VVVGSYVIEWRKRARTGRVDAAGLACAVDLVRTRGATAQLCVLRDGQVVLDRAIGCRPDALFWIFSTSKPFVALLVHLLASAAHCPSTSRWPATGRVRQQGKETITVRQVLATPFGSTGGSQLPTGRKWR